MNNKGMNDMIVWKVWCEWDFEQDSILFATEALAEDWITNLLDNEGEDFQQFKKQGLVGVEWIEVIEEIIDVTEGDE